MKLFFINGPRSGEHLELSGKEVSLGRETDNDVTIEVGGASRYHAKLIKHDDDVWYLKDLGSTNGCKVNAKLIKEERELKNGDIIALGDQILRVDGDESA